MFSYLLNFPTKEAPEKQLIEVSVVSDEGPNSNERRFVGDGLYEYRIEYTDRTWATDISGLLKNHGKTFIQKNNRLMEFWFENRNVFLYTVCSLVFLFSIAFWVSHSYSIFESLPKGNLNGELVIRLLKYIVGSISVMTALWVILSTIKELFEYTFYFSKESFIILTENDSEYMKKRNNRFSRGVLIHLVGWSSAIISGIVANYVYSKILFNL